MPSIGGGEKASASRPIGKSNKDKMVEGNVY